MSINAGYGRNSRWISDCRPEQEAIRAAVEKICARFGDDYWLAKDRDGGFPRRLPSRFRRGRLARHLHAAGVRRRGARHHRSRADDADHRRVRRGHVRRVGAAHEHLRPQPGGGVRQRRAEAAHAAAADRGRGQGLLRGHRAERRPRHAQAEDQGGARRRPLRPVRPEDLDFDRAGREQDADPCAHHAARTGDAPHRGLEPVLHRPRPALRRRPRNPEDGTQRGRLQRAVHRRAAGAGRRPHRRGRQGLRIHPARHESRSAS